MNITTILDIIAVVNISLIAIIIIFETFSFARETKKRLNELSKRCDDYFNTLVQNEYDKQDIYKRLADLEERENNG